MWNLRRAYFWIQMQQVDISASAVEQIEFHKIREILSGYCRGEYGRQVCLDILPSTDVVWITHNLDEVYEYAGLASMPGKFQLTEYADLSAALDQLMIEGYVLLQEEIHELGRQMEQVQNVHVFFSKPERRREFPALQEWTLSTSDPTKLIVLIRKILDEKGEIRPNASPELLSITKSIESEQSRLNKEFARMISSYKAEGWLTDTVESIRAGRRVLCVQAEHKRKVKGIVHDESTTGRTVFIEPEKIVEINNQIIEYEAEFKKEVYRLLKTVCQDLRPHLDELKEFYKLITHWDVIQAMAFLSNSYTGQKPKIQVSPTFHLVHARHPLLVLKNKPKGKEVVPFDLVLNPPNRLLILSGPNAGGKSILLKATGLLQVLAQCGIPIPADGSTVIGIMHRIAVDIGDQQSIEEDLSTYSSRLKNMKETLSSADEATLILVDEFGSGTDPKTGGAIAEAILDALVKRNSYGVLTTHYPNIKMFAHRTKGVLNGAMMFDKERISPTYQLKIGKPGSSFAFEIAERTGLPSDVIAYARKSAGVQTVEMEGLIHDLDQKSHKLETELKEMRDKQKELDRLIANYEQLRMDLEVKRKRFKIDQKKATLQETTLYSKEMNKLMKELRKEKDAEKAREQAEKIREKQNQYSQEIKSLADELIDVSGDKKEFRPGDFVKLQSTQQTGTVERVSKGNATVIIGQIKMTLPLHELVPAKEPVEIKTHRSLQADVEDYSKFENELDIRGMLPEEATQYLEKFIDAAFMSHLDRVRIVHGKGTGVLRKLAGRIMKGYPFKSIHHPDKKEGGDGVTIGLLR